MEGREREEGEVARRISGTLRFPLLSSRTRWNDGAGIRGHFSSVRYLFVGGQGEKRAKRGSFLWKNRFREDCDRGKWREDRFGISLEVGRRK